MSKHMIFYSDNELNLENVKEECLKGKWVAVASYNEENKSKIICFDHLGIAKDFLKRNFKKMEMLGLITVPNEEYERIKEKHSIECFSFPRKISSIKIEVIELETEIELQVNYRKVS